MSALLEIWHAIEAVVMAADYYTLAAGVVIILAAGIMMESMSSIINVTLASLFIFVLAKFALVLALGHHVDLESQAAAFWNGFVDLKMLALAAYLVIFAVLIGAVSTIRSIVR